MLGLKLLSIKYFGDASNLPLSEQLEIARSKKKKLKIECVRKDKCPDCKTKNQMIIGPRGGMSVNVKCGNCGSAFNITPFGVERIAG